MNREKYGTNDQPEFESKMWYEFILEPLKDPMIIILIFAAIIATIIGIIQEHGDIKGALEGIAIMCAVLIVTIVSAYNDWSKEQEFRKLQEVYSNSQK